MNELLKSIHFKSLYFCGKKYDQPFIERAIDHLAAYLQHNVTSESPFILLAAYNHIKTVIAFYAILKAGRIVVLLDPGCKTLELTEIIEDVDPAAMLFINNMTLTYDYEEEIIFRTADRQFVISSDLTDVCLIAYTNAEDGYSKGAMLTEKNLLTEIELLTTTEKITKDSVVCAFLPFHHLYGLLQGVLVPTHQGGAALILTMELQNLQDYMLEINKYRVSHFFTVPSVYYLLSKYDGIERIANNVQYFFSGGTKLSGHIYDLFYKKTGKRIREGYGLTECSPAVALNYQEEPNIESIGLAFPKTTIQILDEEGKILPYGKVGEICVKGDLVFKGYFNRKDVTNKVLKNGWFHTGDLGVIGKNGLIFFKGVKKDMINVAGNNVYPNKLKRLMKLHHNILNVRVFSEDSLLHGQTVIAKIMLQDASQKGINDYKNWCFKNINNVVLPKKWIIK